jgi:hypothetical protein
MCRDARYCASGLFRQIEDKTKVAADERASSRLPPSSHHLHTAMESLDREDVSGVRG